VKHSLSLLAGCALASLAEAQSVLTVDPANGPGALFTSLPAAVAAAADGDVLLLRNGAYDAVALGDKSLTLQAAGRPNEFVQLAGLTISGLAHEDSIVVRGVFVVANGHAIALDLQGCEGPVWIEDVTAVGRVTIADSRQVVLAGVTLEWGYDPAPRQLSEPLTLRDSSVYYSDGSVSGPSGPSPYNAPGLPGAAAIRLEGGELWLQHVGVSGGWGSHGTPSDCAGKSGASAVVLTGTDPELFVLGGGVQGGRGGAGSGSCADGLDAEPVEIHAGTVRLDSTPLRHLYVRSPIREHERMLIDSRGMVGDRVFLLYSIGTKPALLPGLGGFQVAPPYYVTFTGGYGPGSNCATFQATAPELGRGREALGITLQALHWNPDRKETVLTNPIHFLLLDERF
jgi:hypothetical protein